MSDEYELSNLIYSALNREGSPMNLGDSTKKKIHDLCIEYMYSSNRDEFVKKIEEIIQEMARNKMMKE